VAARGGEKKQEQSRIAGMLLGGMCSSGEKDLLRKGERGTRKRGGGVIQKGKRNIRKGKEENIEARLVLETDKGKRNMQRRGRAREVAGRCWKKRDTMSRREMSSEKKED